MAEQEHVKSAVTYKMIAEALFENYESIYDIHMETLEYKTYYQSAFYQGLKLAKEGRDFFRDLPAGIDRIIAPEDQVYVSRMLRRDAIREGLKKDRYYSLVYQIQSGDRKIYHQLRATYQPAEDGMHILMGIKNIDDIIRQNMAHENEIESMRQEGKRERKRFEEELNMSRIRNFTSQMKPHFLYNTLSSIQELIYTDPENAADLLGDFMIHMRSCVRAMSTDDPIPFSEELKNIRAYVNIEKMRLGERLSVEYEIKAADFPVLPLGIQPLVENAIRHGVFMRGKAGGRVSLRTREEKRFWIVEVEDDGVGFQTENLFREIRQGKRDSTGLSNIRFRLWAVLGGTLDIQSSVGEGTLATVRIPRERNQDGRRQRSPFTVRTDRGEG